MNPTMDERISRLGRSIIIVKVLKPILEALLFFVWLIYLVGVITDQDYNGNLTFDLFLARIGGPTASHATTYLIFLSIFPTAYLMLRSVIPAFLIEALAFDVHEGMWQVAYFIGWHSVIDWRVWLVENGLDTVTAAITIGALVLIYHFRAKFFLVVAAAWGLFLSAWLAIGFPVSVLSKLPGNEVIPSLYNTTLWVNQIEFLGWLYFASILLVCLKYLAPGSTPTIDPDPVSPQGTAPAARSSVPTMRKAPVEPQARPWTRPLRALGRTSQERILLRLGELLHACNGARLLDVFQESYRTPQVGDLPCTGFKLHPGEFGCHRIRQFINLGRGVLHLRYLDKIRNDPAAFLELC